jgi:hypothetical protein
LKAEEKEGKGLTVIKLSELREEDEEERTEDILVGKGSSVPICIFQCWGSVTFWCGSGSSDPYL